jgi:hypothetical protein
MHSGCANRGVVGFAWIRAPERSACGLLCVESVDPLQQPRSTKSEQSRRASLGEGRYPFVPRSDAGQLPLAGRETASVFKQFGVRIGLLLPFGEGALVGVLPQLLAGGEVSFRSWLLRMMFDQLLSGGKAALMPVRRVIPIGLPLAVCVHLGLHRA